MLESKRLPREMVFKRACSQDEKIRNDRERLRLLREINGIKETMRKIRRDRDRTLQDAGNLRREIDRLVAKSVFKENLELVLTGLGTLISRGSVSSAGKIIGNALGVLANLVGLTSFEQQIKRRLIQLEGLMLRFQDLGGQLDHLEKGMGRMHQTRDKLKC